MSELVAIMGTFIMEASANHVWRDTTPLPPHSQNQIIFDFCSTTDDIRSLWGAVDDGVMGGISQSSVQIHPDGLLFSGVVSTENSGGFASIRTHNFEPPFDLSAYHGIKLWVKGDGQRYKFFLRDHNTWDSLAYADSFDTVVDQWVRIEIPFATMKPVQRAKTIFGSPLNPAHIHAFQVMLSKFEYDSGLNPHFSPGAFQLLIRSLEVY